MTALVGCDRTINPEGDWICTSVVIGDSVVDLYRTFIDPGIYIDPEINQFDFPRLAKTQVHGTIHLFRKNDETYIRTLFPYDPICSGDYLVKVTSKVSVNTPKFRLDSQFIELKMGKKVVVKGKRKKMIYK
ncbi:MAG: hypothetical protein HYZ16_02660 [Bacteroidetes bacterium]|nr:hypothetical protein [Bacteroidota bacterium]